MIKALFLDIGGVLMTNGWGTDARKGAAEKFNIDYKEMDERHRLTFDTYETGKMSLESYLNEIVFYEPRSFTMGQFIEYMYAVTKPYPEMIELMRTVKERYKLKVAVVSNEGRVITEYRLSNFGLKDFVDFFIVSCFVHFRKPDLDIYKVALDIAQMKPQEVIYIDDRPLFVEIGNKMGLYTIQHKTYAETKQQLETFLNT